MQKKCESVNIQRVANTSRFNKRIGSVTYEVGIHFKSDAKETMDKKIMRLIKNDMAYTPTTVSTLKINKREAV